MVERKKKGCCGREVDFRSEKGSEHLLFFQGGGIMSIANNSGTALGKEGVSLRERRDKGETQKAKTLFR